MHLAVGALKPAVRLEQEGLGGGYFHIEVFINVHGILEAFKQKLHTHTHTKKSDDCSTTRILFSNPQPLWSYFLCFLSFFFLHCSIYREHPHARVNVSQEPLSPRSSVNSRRCSIFDHPPATRLHFVNFFPNPNRVFDVDR